MSIDISCVINAHREASTIFPTINSVKRAVDYALSCGLKVDIHVVLDNSDDVTKDIVRSELTDIAVIHDVMFKDLAHSRNYAITQISSRYTSFIDGDDLWCRSWLVDAFILAEKCESDVVLHPQYNIFFGGQDSHVFNHVDMDDDDYEQEALYRMNYWTALSFARTDIYQQHKYRKNIILEGFGYEDWTWNYETITHGIKHKVVLGTAHFIRKGRPQDSLLAFTNQLNALPRILEIYKRPPEADILDPSDQSESVLDVQDKSVESADDGQKDLSHPSQDQSNAA